MKTPTKKEIEAVAEWWAVRTFDHGDDSFTGMLTMSMKLKLADMDRSNASIDARSKFKNCIIKQLEYDHAITYYCDYDPNEPLRAACDHAGIGYNALPIKTHSQWDGEKYIGRYQYGGKFETIS
jgi:hypothetical protein